MNGDTHPDPIILPNWSHIYKRISTYNKTTDELFNDVSQWIVELTNEIFIWWYIVEVLHIQSTIKENDRQMKMKSCPQAYFNE
jgi:hypothetical protein